MCRFCNWKFDLGSSAVYYRIQFIFNIQYRLEEYFCAAWTSECGCCVRVWAVCTRYATMVHFHRLCILTADWSSALENLNRVLLCSLTRNYSNSNKIIYMQCNLNKSFPVTLLTYLKYWESVVHLYMIGLNWEPINKTKEHAEQATAYNKIREPPDTLWNSDSSLENRIGGLVSLIFPSMVGIREIFECLIVIRFLFALPI